MRTNKNRHQAAGVVGYIRVSTDEQVTSGAGLSAQRRSIRDECERRGWTLDRIYADEGKSGRTLDRRPGLTEALEGLDRGDASTLIVAKLDRLSRSVHDAAGILERAQTRGWSLVALDLGVDTTTPAGEAMANVMATFAQLERRLIGQRTRDALAVKRAQGVRLGRPPTLPQSVVRRIMRAHRDGRSWSAIARELDAARVPTAQGGARWYPATVRTVFLAAEQRAS